jgi:hypothetical protein
MVDKDNCPILEAWADDSLASYINVKPRIFSIDCPIYRQEWDSLRHQLSNQSNFQKL